MSFLTASDPRVSPEARWTHEVITTEAQLTRLAPEWEQLWRADPTATPFQSPQWLLPWWTHVGQGELFTITTRDSAGRLTALLPLYIYREPARGERQLLLLGAGTSDYLGGVFAGERGGGLCPESGDGEGAEQLRCPPSEMARVTLDHLVFHKAHWDRAVLHQLPQASPLVAWAGEKKLRMMESESCSCVTVTGRADLPAKLRANLGRYQRRAQSQGHLYFSVADSEEEVLSRATDLIALHTRRWQERGEDGVLAQAEIQRHHRETIPALFRAGVLRMFTVALDGTTMATLYAFADPPCSSPTPRTRRLYCYLIGFDTAFADLSPGTLLLSYAIEQCEREGLSKLDLLRGGEAYKRLWGAVPQPTLGFELPKNV